MMIFLIGLFCFLLVIGVFVTGGKSPVPFAVISMIVLGALVFVGFIGLILYIILSSR